MMHKIIVKSKFNILIIMILGKNKIKTRLSSYKHLMRKLIKLKIKDLDKKCTFKNQIRKRLLQSMKEVE